MPAQREVAVRRRRRHTLRQHIAEFFESTSIHGLKYISEPNRPLVERLLWLLSLLCAIVVFGLLLEQALSHWRSSPVIVAMDETQKRIWEVPFPAVTICPETKIRSSKFNLTDIIHRHGNLTEKEKEIMSDLEIQCETTLLEADEKNNSAIDRIENYSLPLHGTVVDANYLSNEVDFRPILTEEGICYAFNMLPAHQMFPKETFHRSREYLRYDENSTRWSPSRGYDAGADGTVYPLRAVAAGIAAGIHIMLEIDSKDIDFVCKPLMDGFKVQLHSPEEFPRPGQQFFRVPLNSVVEVAITPSQIVTNDRIKKRYTVQQRKCYFPDERPLRFFLQYTQQNCELECLTNITLQLCHCVAFYMPRVNDTAICGHEYCLKRALRLFHTMESEVNPERTKSGKIFAKCNCLQNCAHIRYHSERSQSSMDIQVFKKSFPQFFEENDDEENYAKLSIYFKESFFIPTRRMEMYGTIEFLANCGGLLGLCLGMSFLSIIEVFYWLVVRMLSRSRRISEQRSKET